MESTRKCRRLGDLLGGTVVLKQLPYRESLPAHEEIRYGGATARTFAFCIDLIFISVFAMGLLLLNPVSEKIVSRLLLNLSPLLVLLYLTVAEFSFGTTVGKILFGLKVTEEGGTPPSFAAILVRNLLRPLDLNPLGYLVAFLSSRKQRLGDLFSGTAVIRTPRSLRGWMVIPFMLIFAGGTGALGWINPDNFVKKGHWIRVGDYLIQPIPRVIDRYRSDSLRIERFQFAFNEVDLNRRGRFSRGDVIFLLFRVDRFLVRNGRAWVQADLKVKDPSGSIVLNRANVVNASIRTGLKRYADLATRFALHPQATPGRYTVTLTLRDRFAKTTVFKNYSFEVY